MALSEKKLFCRFDKPFFVCARQLCSSWVETQKKFLHEDQD